MSERFYFTNSDDSTSNLSDGDHDTELPFPKPLNRASFLAPEFDPSVFLSSLSNRFQTLEDLQEELRELGQSLNKELVDLVNDNYQDFLSLGTALAGGEEKIEEIRVGVLGFQRDIGSVREKVELRRKECEGLLAEKKTLRREINTGRVLLEIAERIEQLEERLRIPRNKTEAAPVKEQTGDGSQWSDDWTEELLGDEDEEYDHESGIPNRLRNAVSDFHILGLLMKKHDPRQPFLVSQLDRISRIQDAIHVNLESAIKLADDVKIKQRLLQLRTSLED